MEKLDVEILKTEYAVSYGSVTLKSLQNDNVPELDLLVREAIQNSSDASLRIEGESYSVNFNMGTFAPRDFNSHMTLIETKLNELFPESTADYLEIRDTGTCGLTGCTRKEDIKRDDHGNFFKLIYDTGKRQTLASAGGNWGFGKSVYYRVGIGIVLFYSRIKESNQFKDRLIITLVEDEGKQYVNGQDATILNGIEPLSAGKAWWGIKDGDNLLPLENEEDIIPVLSIFSIKPFKENETGTSIIIPYIKTAELLDGIVPVEIDMAADVKEHFLMSYATTLSSYIRLSIQKWYSPKIHNRSIVDFCDSKWLRATVDNVPIRKKDLLPFFDLVQELYTAALAKAYDTVYKSERFPDIRVLTINIRDYLESGMTAGFLSYLKIRKSDMDGGTDALTPYDYIGKFEADGRLNEPIVMYTRDPGMVIDYDITGPWVKNIPAPESQDEYVIAFFVPASRKKIKLNFAIPEYAGMELGEYLRKCEASDHMGWNDPVKMQIVKRIQRNVINQIRNEIKKDSRVVIDATASKLSNRLGKDLLPRIGYGKTKVTGGGPGGGGGTKIKNLSLEIFSQSIKKEKAEMGFRLKMSHGKKESKMSIMIASEAGWIDAESWFSDIGTVFPVAIEECRLDYITTPVTEEKIEINETCNNTKRIIEKEEIKLEITNETQGDVLTQVGITSYVSNPEIVGTLLLRTLDKKYQFTIRLE